MGMKEKVANKTQYRGTHPGQAPKLMEGGSSELEYQIGRSKYLLLRCYASSFPLGIYVY